MNAVMLKHTGHALWRVSTSRHCAVSARRSYVCLDYGTHYGGLIARFSVSVTCSGTWPFFRSIGATYGCSFADMSMMQL